MKLWLAAVLTIAIVRCASISTPARGSSADLGLTLEETHHDLRTGQTATVRLYLKGHRLKVEKSAPGVPLATTVIDGDEGTIVEIPAPGSAPRTRSLEDLRAQYAGMERLAKSKDKLAVSRARRARATAALAGSAVYEPLGRSGREFGVECAEYRVRASDAGVVAVTCFAPLAALGLDGKAFSGLEELAVRCRGTPVFAPFQRMLENLEVRGLALRTTILPSGSGKAVMEIRLEGVRREAVSDAVFLGPGGGA